MKKIVFAIGLAVSVSMMFFGFQGIRLEKELKNHWTTIQQERESSQLLKSPVFQELEERLNIAPEQIEKNLQKGHFKTLSLIVLGLAVFAGSFLVFKNPKFCGLVFLIVLLSHLAIWNVQAKLLDIVLMLLLALGTVLAFKTVEKGGSL